MSERILLITGCSSGIGHDAAHGLRARGWRVFASCRKPDDCDRLRAEGFESPLIDYADPASVETGLAEVLAATDGRLDALFNNGAHALPGLLEDVPRDGLAALLEVNLLGWHQLSRAAIPALRATGRGRIVNCSSVLGIVPFTWRGAYVASKFAVEGWSDVLRMELRETGPDVILIQPGPIRTPFRRNTIPHFERWIDWRGSARRAEYEGKMDALYGKAPSDRFELPPSAVTAALVRALEDPRPRARYRVTVPTRAAEVMRRLLPTRARDRLLGG